MDRLIPAGAGQTNGSAPGSTTTWAHPRWRGADPPPPGNGGGGLGSSPLARGRLQVLIMSGAVAGLIPAGAGQTWPAPGRRCRGRAHPRWRGADPGRERMGLRGRGSSPLARGRRSADGGIDSPAGLIPAGAGPTPRPGHTSAGRAAHPRWRGADVFTHIDVKVISGSSPLARGRRRPRRPAGPRIRLIPAGAGQTSWEAKKSLLERAHPRWRGADRTPTLEIIQHEGSSPLARGRQHHAVVGPDFLGLIPAGAGQTSRHSSLTPFRRAHPRWRGADRTRPRPPMIFFGSSPLARGRPNSSRKSSFDSGLIPAGAGQTR